MTTFANEQRLIAAFAKLREAREEIHAIVAEAEAQAYEWFEAEAYHKAHPNTVGEQPEEIISPAVEKTPGVEPQPESAPVPAAEPTPKPEPEPVVEQPTLEELRATLMAAQRAGHKDNIKTMLVGFGATKLSDLDPTHYQAALDTARSW